MRTITYATWDDRLRLCAQAEAQGEQMLHDEVREVVEAGKPVQVNVLVFDWPLPEPPPPPLNQRQVRQVRIAELIAINRSDWTAAQLRELLQLVAQEVSP